MMTNRDDYKNVSELEVTSFEIDKSWIMDAGCSYHMCFKERIL